MRDETKEGQPGWFAPENKLAPQVGLEPTTLRLTAEPEVFCLVLRVLAIRS